MLLLWAESLRGIESATRVAALHVVCRMY